MREVWPRIYVASRKKNAPMLRDHRARGINIISTWIDRPEDFDQNTIWRNAISEIESADMFIIHDGGDGALIELGMALGFNRYCVCTARGGPWDHIGLVFFFKSLEDAFNDAEIPF